MGFRVLGFGFGVWGLRLLLLLRAFGSFSGLRVIAYVGTSDVSVWGFAVRASEAWRGFRAFRVRVYGLEYRGSGFRGFSSFFALGM